MNISSNFTRRHYLNDFDEMISLLEGRYNSVLEKVYSLNDSVELIQNHGVTEQISRNIGETVRTLDAELSDMYGIENVIFFEMRHFFPGSSFIKAFESENKLIYTLLDPLRTIFTHEEKTAEMRDVIITEIIFMAEIIQRNINKKKSVLFEQVKEKLSSEERNILTQRIDTLYFTRFSVN